MSSSINRQTLRNSNNHRLTVQQTPANHAHNTTDNKINMPLIEF